MIKKYIILTIIYLVIFSSFNFIYATDDIMQKALDSIDTKELEDYIRSTSDYFSSKNITIKQLINDALKGKLSFNILDFFSYQFKNEKNFLKQTVLSSINILIICIILTIIKYFSEEISSNNVSDIVVFISIIIVFIMATKDIGFVKSSLKNEFIKFNDITQNINSLFLAFTVSFGKIGLLEFFQRYSQHVIGMTANFMYNFVDIMTIVLIAIILINNISKFVNAKLLYEFLKKATLIILSLYIIVVVINFSVQGYIYYKTDNLFINAVKAVSPSSIPMVGNALNNFFGLFAKSVLFIKDIAGFVIILFIFSVFGGSIIRIFIIFVLYKITAAFAETFNESISNLLKELADVMYIYLICLLTPVIILTSYYSIMLSYLNNIFG
jgi:stage III sporulation protein AE